MGDERLDLLLPEPDGDANSRFRRATLPPPVYDELLLMDEVGSVWKDDDAELPVPAKKNKSC